MELCGYSLAASPAHRPFARHSPASPLSARPLARPPARPAACRLSARRPPPAGPLSISRPPRPLLPYLQPAPSPAGLCSLPSHGCVRPPIVGLHRVACHMTQLGARWMLCSGRRLHPPLRWMSVVATGGGCPPDRPAALGCGRSGRCSRFPPRLRRPAVGSAQHDVLALFAVQHLQHSEGRSQADLLRPACAGPSRPVPVLVGACPSLSRVPPPTMGRGGAPPAPFGQHFASPYFWFATAPRPLCRTKHISQKFDLMRGQRQPGTRRASTSWARRPARWSPSPRR